MPSIPATAIIYFYYFFYYCHHIMEALVRTIYHETEMTSKAIENKQRAFSLFIDYIIVL